MDPDICTTWEVYLAGTLWGCFEFQTLKEPQLAPYDL